MFGIDMVIGIIKSFKTILERNDDGSQMEVANRKPRKILVS